MAISRKRWRRWVFQLNFFLAAFCFAFALQTLLRNPFKVAPPKTAPSPTVAPIVMPTVAEPVTPVPPAALSPAPSPSPTPLPAEEPSATPNIPLASAQLPPGLKLIIPVAGVKPEQLRDTFSEARSQGRVHNALDIMAQRGTPVLAAAEGTVVRLFQSERGGITLYQSSKDQKVVFYYAHLDRYADGLKEGQQVRQGEVIAYVGDTGNAGAGNYHLHFAVWLVDNPKHFWNGVNLNPYLLLKEAR
jgi:murein DD-endopeptidase MepM/ murein hydrolase activator NlpD